MASRLVGNCMICGGEFELKSRNPYTCGKDKCKKKWKKIEKSGI